MISDELKYFVEQMNIILKENNIGEVKIDYTVDSEDDMIFIIFIYYVNNIPRFEEKAVIPLEVYKTDYNNVLKELSDDFYRNLLMRTEFLQKKDILTLETYQLN